MRRVLLLITAASLISALVFQYMSAMKSNTPSPLTLYVPCTLSGPMRGAVSEYEKLHPNAAITILVEKPLAILEKVKAQQQEEAVVLAMGESEMSTLIEAGMVDRRAVRTFASSRSSLLVIAAAKGSADLKQVQDLARPTIERIFVEDSKISSLGVRAEEALKKIGLWDQISSKIVHPNPEAMVLGELVAGKADAAVVMQDCLLGESGTGSPPKTIRIVGQLPSPAAPTFEFQAAPLKNTPSTQTAEEFIEFLTSDKGKAALKAKGL